MPNQHKNPVLGWRPPVELVARLKALIDRRAERRGGDRRGVQTEALNEALQAYLDRSEGE